MTDTEILDYLESRIQFRSHAYDVQIGDVVFTVHANTILREALTAAIEKHVALRVSTKLDTGKDVKRATIKDPWDDYPNLKDGH